MPDIPAAQSLRALPRVDATLAALMRQEPGLARGAALQAAQEAIAEQRRALLENGSGSRDQEIEAEVLKSARRLARRRQAESPRRVLNATGIIVHTGLGRSLLSDASVTAVARVAGAHCALEVDPETGERGHRDAAVAELLCRLTGCEDATVSNNCAAAVTLALNTLADGRQVACSRGELVEIGGGFRMPDVMAKSGCTLIEVGCTNKTRLSDYAAIINGVGALLKVHTSNFRLVGFTEAVATEQLARLAHEHGLNLVEDLGSGALVDLERAGLQGEPTVQKSLRAGADVVCFSGDKLLGGPQCGIICGRREPIERIRRNSLMRAMRVDKFTVAALEATLRHYLDEDEAWAEIPTLAALAMPLSEVRRRAWLLNEKVAEQRLPAEIDVVDSEAQAGAGSLPAQPLPSAALAVAPQGLAVAALAQRLRSGPISVWGHIRNNQLLLDCRTLRDSELDDCAGALVQAFMECESAGL